MPANAHADDQLLQLALSDRIIFEADLAEAEAGLADHAGEATSVYDYLVKQGKLDTADLMVRLADQFGMTTVDVDHLDIPEDVLGLITRSQAVHYQLLPLARRGDSLEVALADPLSTDGVDTLAHLLQISIVPRLASAGSILLAIDRCYVRPDTTITDILEAASKADSTPSAALTGNHEESSDSDAPIIKLVHTIITKAVQLRASDIHLEPMERYFRVRYRIDGVLIPGETPPKRLQAAIISRLKIMAGISIAEKRLPQDGRIQINADGRTLDLRVSSLPSSHGEGIVMRILDQESLKFGLSELGFLADDRAVFERLVGQPDGILLVTGPTGSGKTTTLYSCLHAINQPDRKIITVEDPVEYQMSGINQVPVRAELGMTFAAALRAILRQAPNIVMVGEIRDLETAEIAIHASLTGHNGVLHLAHQRCPRRGHPLGGYWRKTISGFDCIAWSYGPAAGAQNL